jgi:hypothetical protein
VQAPRRLLPSDDVCPMGRACCIPRWGHYDVIMQRRSVNSVSRQAAATRVPVTVRLPENVVQQIDRELNQRDVPLSRNNWLLEAALEKLRKSTMGGGHGSQ